MSVDFKDNTAKVKAALSEGVVAFLHEAGGEIVSQTQDNSRVDTGQTKGSYKYVVDEGHDESTVAVGSDLENAIWEEFGTGEYALHGDGRKGGWTYIDEKGQGHHTHGNTPKSSSYIWQSDSVRVSFFREQCEGCPYQSECNPKLKPRTATLLIPLKSRRRIVESSEIMDDETRNLIGRIRNGVETVPSIIRNKYLVDKMPVRGKLRTKQFFGFKIATLNVSKLQRFIQGKLKCRSFEMA